MRENQFAGQACSILLADLFGQRFESAQLHQRKARLRACLFLFPDVPLVACLPLSALKRGSLGQTHASKN